MIKKMISILLITLLVMGSIDNSTHAAGKGVDRGKFKGQVNSYPVTLTIGSLSFDGTLSRGNSASDEEIEKAIKEVLKDMKINELDIGDAERLVEKVAKDEEFTDEDIKEIRDNLLQLAGLDTLADVTEYVLGDSDKSADEIAGDYAIDEAKEKVLDILLEGAGEGAGNVATKILDTVIISADQYEKDKEKWKNRAADAIAKRLLNEFYDKVKEKIENQANQRSKGWTLKIDTWGSRNFTFYQTEGNLETCKVLIDLKKADTENSMGASGTYTGFVDITFDYEMSAYDKGFLDWSTTKSGFRDQYASNLPGVKLDYTDDYSPSYINRKLVHQNFSVNLSVPISKGMVTKTNMNFSSLDDSKMIAINHKITEDGNWSAEGIKMNHHYVVTYSADSDEKLSVSAVSTASVTADGKTTSVDSKDQKDLDWDEAIWEQWEKDKWLAITYP